MTERTPKASQALHVHETLATTLAGWMVLYSFLFAGESYDYMFEVAGGNATETQVRDLMKQLQTYRRGERNFLRDVTLDMELPN